MQRQNPNCMHVCKLCASSYLVAGAAPTEVRIAGIMNDSDGSIVTIEWTPPTPPPTRGYTVTTDPAPISPATVNTTSTSIDITMQYNTNYTVTVGSITCDGLKTTTADTLFLGNGYWL